MENRESLHIKYDGDDLTTHEFDIKELSAVFGALGTIFENANFLANDRHVDFRVKVDAKFTPGSFEFLVLLQQTFNEQTIGLLAGTAATAFVNSYTIITILFGEQFSLISLLRYLKGKLPTKKVEQGKNVLIYRTQDEFLEVGPEVFALYENKRVRNALAIAITDAITRPGIDSVSFQTRNLIGRVEKGEAQYFSAPIESADEVIDEDIIESELEIVTMSFDPTKKWEFRSYKDTFTAEIEDQKFREEVQGGKHFKKGDRIKTLLKIELYKTDQKVMKRRTIVEVLKHIQLPEQYELDE